MQHEFLLIERLRDINCNKIFNNRFCHSVGNLAKQFDGVDLTEAKAMTVQIRS